MGTIRRTKSVLALLEVFDQTDSAHSVVALVDRFEAEMNKTTVYRILERMEKEGLLHSFSGQHGLKWYAKCKTCSGSDRTGLHPHFQCRDCGKTECLSLKVEVPSVPKYKVEAAELLLSGVCEDCLAQS